MDSDGNQYQLIHEIVYHKKYKISIKKSDGFTSSRNGNRFPNMTTCRWKLLVDWKYGSSDWINLKDLKFSNPIELVEYAVVNRINDEPIFHWCVGEVFKFQNQIISKVKSEYL